MTLKFDLLIIGSGAGGGVVAHRLAPLAEKGLRIAVLEAGPHFPPEYRTQREIEMMDLFYNRAAWPTRDGAVTISFGEALGGSTLMYTGVTFRLPDEVCRGWNLPGITPEELAPRFDRLEREVHVMDPDEGMTNRNNSLFREACEQLGYPVKKLALNVLNCEQFGFCNLGCRGEHKMGTLAVQLPRAAKKGVQLIPNCRVVGLKEGLVEAVVKAAPPGTVPGPISPGPYKIWASRVVLAGGTVGSSALLLRSGFGRELPALGRYVTIHPALTVSGIHPEIVDGHKGFPKVYFSDYFSESEGFYLETAFYYPFITAKNTGLWGESLQFVMKRYRQLMSILLLVHDEAAAANRIRLDRKGRPYLDYELSDEVVRSLCRAQLAASRVFFAAGCTHAVLPSGRRILVDRALFGKEGADLLATEYFVRNRVPVSSAHLQGGCRMGRDRAGSVTDTWGRVHGHPWLYVADGSLFPGSSQVNPYLTIMALAERVAEKVRSEMV